MRGVCLAFIAVNSTRVLATSVAARIADSITGLAVAEKATGEVLLQEVVLSTVPIASNSVRSISCRAASWGIDAKAVHETWVAKDRSTSNCGKE